MPESLMFRCGSCGGLNRVLPDRLDADPTCGRCQSVLDLDAHPHEVDDDQLDRLVRGASVPVLVDFWAPWCGPCRVVAPHLVKLAERYAGRLIVAKVNVDNHKRTAGTLRVQGIPTLAIYEGGQLRHRQAGAVMGAQLDAFIAPYL
jgi:thioredoxin 2